MGGDRHIENLVQQASRGDAVAIDGLLAQNLSGLRAFVRLRTGRAIREQESCSDLVQSVCREVLGSLDRFEYQGAAAFKGWLFTTALRKITERDAYYRAQKRDVQRNVRLQWSTPEGAADLLDCYASVCTPSRAVEAREHVQRVEQAFDELPEEYREVITLARVVGLPHSEIAARMNRTEEASRALLRRAMVRLAILLEEAEAGP